MIRRPPRSTLFPYTNALPISVEDAGGVRGLSLFREGLSQLFRRREAGIEPLGPDDAIGRRLDRKSTRLNSSHSQISYAVFCLKKKKPSTGLSRSSVTQDTAPN